MTIGFTTEGSPVLEDNVSVTCGAKVLAPDEFVDEIKEEIGEISKYYSE